MTTSKSSRSKPRIILTGGGTGGHITPLVALTEALADRADIHLVIEHGDETSHRTFANLSVSVHEVRAGKLRRYHGRTGWYFFHPTNVWENIRDSSRVVRGSMAAWRLLRKLQPDAVFVKGGYVALPVGLAAASLGIPIVTHDSDVLPGLTNRIVARWAKKIAVGFPRENYPHYPARKLVHVGVPVRKEFSKMPVRHTRHGGPHILVTGGSLGARAINQIILAIGKHLLGQGRVVHIAGPREFAALDAVTQEWQATGRYRLLDYVEDELFDLVTEADVVVTRAGATTMTEFAISGVPMIIIPSPFLTGGHQLQNALVVEQAAAAVVLGEPQLQAQPMLLVDTVRELLADSKKQQWLVRNARSLFPDDATERLADLILEVARSSDQ